jgi:hypothetical protein
MNSDDAQKKAKEILSIFRTPEARAHFSRIGSLGGSASSKAKAQSAKANGKKGGRPPGKRK